MGKKREEAILKAKHVEQKKLAIKQKEETAAEAKRKVEVKKVLAAKKKKYEKKNSQEVDKLKSMEKEMAQKTKVKMVKPKKKSFSSASAMLIRRDVQENMEFADLSSADTSSMLAQFSQFTQLSATIAAPA